MSTRKREIWLGESVAPDEATAYRKRWVAKLADERGITRQEAYQLLCAEYGDPPELLFAVHTETERRTFKGTVKTVRALFLQCSRRC